jgi:hypothetical protein
MHGLLTANRASEGLCNMPSSTYGEQPYYFLSTAYERSLRSQGCVSRTCHTCPTGKTILRIILQGENFELTGVTATGLDAENSKHCYSYHRAEQSRLCNATKGSLRFRVCAGL